MKGRPPPLLESRDAEALLAELLRRAEAYLPEWRAQEGGPGLALLRAHARLLSALNERLNQALEKNRLAFLDQLGIDLLPAQSARAPVVFTLLPGAGDGEAPAGTRLSAEAPDGGDPIVFETTRRLRLASAALAEVRSVWPGRDQAADHTAAIVGGHAFSALDNWTPLEHELYLSHDVHLALAARSEVEIDVRMAQCGDSSLEVRWSWWDGDVWRPFSAFADEDRADKSHDETAGLSRAGTVRLLAECAATEARVVHGHEGLWIRARLDGPLVGGVLAQIDTLRLRTRIDRPLPTDGSCGGALLADEAYGVGQTLDTTKTFHPFGQQPGSDAAFYVRSSEAFDLPGADVTVRLGHVVTPQDAAAQEVSVYEAGIQIGDDRLQEARDLAVAVDAILEALVATDGELGAGFVALFDANVPNSPDIPNNLYDWYADIRARASDAYEATRDSAQPAQTLASAALTQALVLSSGLGTLGLAQPAVAVAAAHSAIFIATSIQIIVNLASAARALASSSNQTLIDEVDALEQQAGVWETARQELASLDFSDPSTLDPVDVLAALAPLPATIPALTTAFLQVAGHLDDWGSNIWLPSNLPPVFDDAKQRFQDLKDRITTALNQVKAARVSQQALITLLDSISAAELLQSQGVLPPFADPPQLVWEYWDGRRWRELVAPVGGEVAQNLLASGTVSFTVPGDWAPTEINGTEERWLRLRLAQGSYNRLRIVSWRDIDTKMINLLPVLLPSPPALDALCLGYTYRSPSDPAQVCLSHNDFAWRDHTASARWAKRPFEAFRATEEPTPSLYLGFDGPLPPGNLGLLVHADEQQTVTDPPPLTWEHWDGSRWMPLAVRDESRHLSRTGTIEVTWPGDRRGASVPLRAGSARVLQVLDARLAARFVAGDLLWVETDGEGELATLDAVEKDRLQLQRPLQGEYAGGTVSVAWQPRFGTPRSWIRARLVEDGEPVPLPLLGLHANATWATESRTVANELLGSATGEPDQVFFFSGRPVLDDEEIEVLELSGARAAIELPLLREELQQAGIASDHVRVVEDADGRVHQVWIRWSGRPHLFFSGPDDRHYVVDRARGRLLFGDGSQGRPPPAGQDNVRARRYRAGGGVRGNVPAGAIAQVLSGTVAQSVTNPVAAEAGADTESVARVAARGPATLRHRRQALSLRDWEAVALEASPAIATTRAWSLPGSARVTVVVLPESAEPRPSPSRELRRQVHDFLVRRMPATVAGRFEVRGPTWHPVGVRVRVVAEDPQDSGPVVQSCRAALHEFFHPLRGGPDGCGWPFGRDVHQSDVAVVLEGVEGVDHATDLVLTFEGQAFSERVPVPADRLVAAGEVDVLAAAGEL